MTYEENIDPITEQVVNIIATDDEGNQTFIPLDEGNKDYQVYLAAQNQQV